MESCDRATLLKKQRFTTLAVRQPLPGPLPSPSSTVARTTYEQALHKLVISYYLKASTVLSHVSPRDKLIRYEAEEKAKITGFPSAKQLREAKELAEARIKREEAEAEKIGMVSTNVVVLQNDNSVEPSVFSRNPNPWRVHIANR